MFLLFLYFLFVEFFIWFCILLMYNFKYENSDNDNITCVGSWVFVVLCFFMFMIMLLFIFFVVLYFFSVIFVNILEWCVLVIVILRRIKFLIRVYMDWLICNECVLFSCFKRLIAFRVVLLRLYSLIILGVIKLLRLLFIFLRCRRLLFFLYDMD